MSKVNFGLQPGSLSVLVSCSFVYSLMLWTEQLIKMRHSIQLDFLSMLLFQGDVFLCVFLTQPGLK